MPALVHPELNPCQDSVSGTRGIRAENQAGLRVSGLRRKAHEAKQNWQQHHFFESHGLNMPYRSTPLQILSRRHNFCLMLAAATGTQCTWLCSGQEFFSATLAAIDQAQHSVCLETYIYSAGALGQRFREALCRARQRGVRVRVLLDALGSFRLPASFWKPLQTLGGQARFSNPLSLYRLGIRNHRKVLACDDKFAFVGGFNISAEYEG